MNLKISGKYLMAFFALCLVMFETHEFVHIITGRIICGCWGERNFNVWGLCHGCTEAKPLSVLATFTGPLYSYVLIWLGAYFLMKGATIARQAMGFSLIFANLPLARIVTAAMRGGDEIFGLREWLGTPDRSNSSLIWLLGGVLVLVLTIPPLIAAYKALQNRNKLWVFIGFLILPMLAGFAVIFGVLNPLMTIGVLDQIGLCGTPVLINLWTLFVVLFFLLTRKNLAALSNER
jgi:hypothetical protein